MPISKEERDRRFKAVQQEARISISKRESHTFTIKLSPDTILGMYEIGDRERKGIHELIQNWITEGVANAITKN